MKAFGVLAFAAAAKLVFAHATIQAAWINGVDQGLGNSASGYIRSPPNNSPLVDVKSKDITCNVNNVATAKTLSVKAGDKFEFEWHHESRSAGDQIIDPSHKGPVLVYIAPTDKGTAGNGWVKLAEDGFDGQWAVERLRANGGRHSVVIPDIVPGDYLLRGEIIALHEGDRLNGAQFYMECIQVKITSSGTTTLPAGVSIPGTYSATDPGILFDLYNGVKPYPIPGPPVWDGASSGPAPTTPAPTASTPATTRVATTFQTVVKPTSSSTTSPPATTSVATTFQTVVKPTSSGTASPPATTTPPAACGGGSVAIYQQCGGINYSGPTDCQSGLICKEWNPYYFQCISN